MLKTKMGIGISCAEFCSIHVSNQRHGRIYFLLKLFGQLWDDRVLSWGQESSVLQSILSVNQIEADTNIFISSSSLDPIPRRQEVFKVSANQWNLSSWLRCSMVSNLTKLETPKETQDNLTIEKGCKRRRCWHRVTWTHIVPQHPRGSGN